jgi:hypothetical protein
MRVPGENELLVAYQTQWRGRSTKRRQHQSEQSTKIRHHQAAPSATRIRAVIGQWRPTDSAQLPLRYNSEQLIRRWKHDPAIRL